jgi:hypothetical protein
MSRLVLRAALAIGFLIDFGVGAVSVVAPQLLQPLFDVPIKDVMTAQIAGGELVVASLVYALAFRDPVRFRALLWICALDQLFAVVLPSLGIARGDLPASWKIVAPIPFQALLALLFVVYAVRRTPSPQPA